MAKDDGGPAFAYLVEQHQEPCWQIDPSHEFVAQALPPATITKVSGGMSLRDYFAAAALQGSLADAENLETMHKLNKPKDMAESQAILSKVCYLMADAMLAERAK